MLLRIVVGRCSRRWWNVSLQVADLGAAALNATSKALNRMYNSSTSQSLSLNRKTALKPTPTGLSKYYEDPTWRDLKPLTKSHDHKPYLPLRRKGAFANTVLPDA